MATKNEQTQMSVRILAAKNEKAISDGFQQAIENSQEGVILSQLSIAIGAGDILAAEQATRPDKFESEMTAVTNGQRDAFKAGADQAHSELPKSKIKLARTIDMLSPAALLSLNTEGSRLVTNISDQTRLAITDLLEDVILRGVPPTRAARQIREIIGLNRVQAGAIQRQREALEQAGTKQSVIDNTLSRRTKKMINSRAKTIARTEAGRAVGQGRQRMWDQLVEDDIIEPGTQKKWITALDERVGSDHRPMHKVVVGINEEFFIPETGQSVQVPNDSRPNCRCTAVLIFN